MPLRSSPSILLPKAAHRLPHYSSETCIVGLLALVLVSCGGGAVSNASTDIPAIAFMSAFPAASGVPGIIAAPVAQSLTIYGTNFVSGTNVTISNNSNYYPVTAASVISSSEIKADVTIPYVPTDSYVTVTLQPPTGDPVSGILGVAHSYKTLANDIQPILSANCVSCHDSTGAFDMSTTTDSAINLIQAQSTGCPSDFRVIAGDPRRGRNVLIDVIKAKAMPEPAAFSCNNGSNRQMPQGVAPPLTTADIDSIVDWIALGAN